MIYLDHAATSFPKPPGVLAAIQRWYTEIGVSASRGDSGLCQAAAQVVDRVRRRLATACGVPRHRLLFQSGATEALNTFIWGRIKSGMRVLTTSLEHSSLARVLCQARESAGIEFEVLPVDAAGYLDLDLVAGRLRQGSFDLFAFSHASNVLGSVQDAATLCQIARDAGVQSLVDASASAGLWPLDLGADAILASAHKSLLGPPGLGFLALREGIELQPTRLGGTGSSTALDRQPETWPERFEPGTPNTPAIFGLDAALDWLDSQDQTELRQRELALLDELRAALPASVTCYGPPAGHAQRIPLLSFQVPGLDPAEVGLLLDAQGIHVRSGFHCAPWIHDQIGSGTAGTVRVSLGPFVSAADVLQVPRALPG